MVNLLDRQEDYCGLKMLELKILCNFGGGEKGNGYEVLAYMEIASLRLVGLIMN